VMILDFHSRGKLSQSGILPDNNCFGGLKARSTSFLSNEKY